MCVCVGFQGGVELQAGCVCGLQTILLAAIARAGELEEQCEAIDVSAWPFKRACLSSI